LSSAATAGRRPSLAPARLAGHGQSLELRTIALDRWLLGFVLAGVAIRIVYAFVLHGPQDIGDQIQYVDLGHNFKSWWQSPDALRTPGYPFLLAVNFNLGLGLVGVRIEQALALGVACLLVSILATRLAGLRAGRIAAFGTMIFPPLITLSAPILSDAVATSLFVASVFALVEGYRRHSWMWWLAASSALGGAAALVRPNLVLALPIVLVVGLLHAGRARQRLAVLVVIALPVLFLFGPWVGRNYAELGRPAPLGVNDGPRLVFAAGVHLPIDTTSGAYGAYRRSEHFYSPGTGPRGSLNIATARQVRPWHTLLDNILHRPFRQIAASAFWQRELWLEAFDDHAQYGVSPKIPYGLSLTLQIMLLALGLGGLWIARSTLIARVVFVAAVLLALPFLVHLPEPRYAAPQLLLLMAPAAAVLSSLLPSLARARPGARRTPASRAGAG
jgi:4-amino-4-deoxy-L-arabinose transferase-like glycosyltransferase